MNLPRLILSIVVLAVFFCVYEALFHGMLLKEQYEATAEAWRSEEDSQARMRWILLAYFLMAAGFCLIWAKGFGSRGLLCGLLFGGTLWLIAMGGHILGWVFQPVPGQFVGYWAVGGLVELAVAGILAAWIYRPKAAADGG